jgi:hypothetical protein
VSVIENRIAVAIGVTSLIAGIALLAIGGSFAVVLAGAILLGLAGIAFVSLAFLLVGQSEDRDRRG